MSWFKQKLGIYEIDGVPLSGTEVNNPYISIVTEEFVKIPILPHPSQMTTPGTEATSNGSSNESSDIPG